VRNHNHIDGGHKIDVAGPNGTAMRFETDASDVVVYLAVGRTPPVFYSEGCA
jgi:hypothetical protein